MTRSSAICLLGSLLCAASIARADTERFVDSDEAKEKEYRQGCAITDYSDLVSGDGVDSSSTGS